MWFEKKATKKDLKKSFEDVKKDIQSKVSKKEFEQLHKQLHSATARSNLNKTEKRFLKKLDVVKLHQAIQFYLEQNSSTSVIRDGIMNKFDIGERCFYNHLKQAKELHRPLNSVTALNTAHKLNNGGKE